MLQRVNTFAAVITHKVTKPLGGAHHPEGLLTLQDQLAATDWDHRVVGPQQSFLFPFKYIAVKFAIWLIRNCYRDKK